MKLPAFAPLFHSKHPESVLLPSRSWHRVPPTCYGLLSRSAQTITGGRVIGHTFGGIKDPTNNCHIGA